MAEISSMVPIIFDFIHSSKLRLDDLTPDAAKWIMASQTGMLSFSPIPTIHTFPLLRL